MKVILNRWLGDKFENNAACNCCGNRASVAQFEFDFWEDNPLCIWLCAVCLHKAQQAISDAIMETVAGRSQYEPTDEGEPD